MATQSYTEPTTLTNVASTELNSLADGGSATGSNLSNDGSTEGYEWANLELNLASIGSARTSSTVIVYMAFSVDGTNWSDNIIAVAAFTDVPLSTAAYRGIAQGVRLPNCDYRYLIENETGQAFAASGNTLKEEKYQLETA